MGEPLTHPPCWHLCRQMLMLETDKLLRGPGRIRVPPPWQPPMGVGVSVCLLAAPVPGGQSGTQQLATSGLFVWCQSASQQLGRKGVVLRGGADPCPELPKSSLWNMARGLLRLKSPVECGRSTQWVPVWQRAPRRGGAGAVLWVLAARAGCWQEAPGILGPALQLLHNFCLSRLLGRWR